METITANEAKTHFGETILKTQRNPVTITRNGKPVAVMISFKEYQDIEELKQVYLQQQIKLGLLDIENAQTTDGTLIFKELLKNKMRL
jgi:prevent-host-death family protein